MHFLSVVYISSKKFLKKLLAYFSLRIVSIHMFEGQLQVGNTQKIKQTNFENKIQCELLISTLHIFIHSNGYKNVLLKLMIKDVFTA